MSQSPIIVTVTHNRHDQPSLSQSPVIVTTNHHCHSHPSLSQSPIIISHRHRLCQVCGCIHGLCFRTTSCRQQPHPTQQGRNKFQLRQAQGRNSHSQARRVAKTSISAGACCKTVPKNVTPKWRDDAHDFHSHSQVQTIRTNLRQALLLSTPDQPSPCFIDTIIRR
jgi:hypothetical protein